MSTVAVPARGRRYPITVVKRARELHDAGWTIAQIARLLESELGAAPRDDTIRCWVNETYRQQRTVKQARSQARHRVRRVEFKLGGGGHGITQEYLRAFVAALRAEGLSPNAIAGVLRVQHDQRWTRHMVTSFLAGGEPWMLRGDR